MNSSPPDTDEIPTLIRLAYDRLPEPDAERLAAIETRLIDQLKHPRRRSGGFHWGWLLLLAGGAAAATWWSGDLWLQTEEEQLIEEATPQSEPAADETPDKASEQPDAMKEKDTNNASGDGQRTPLIYRRESF